MRVPVDSVHAAWESGLRLSWATEEEFERHRIRHRLPRWGTDCDEGNLPQEFQRDAWAISFTKGCYLGQETVARIDALGHVNRVLAVLEMECMPTGVLPLDASDENGQVVGRATSIVQDSDRKKIIAIATIKRSVANRGTSLRIGGRPALVVEGLVQAR
jgi:folate-binding protein YgfZ